MEDYLEFRGLPPESYEVYWKATLGYLSEEAYKEDEAVITRIREVTRLWQLKSVEHFLSGLFSKLRF